VHTSGTLSDRVAALARKLGLAGAVLLAALVCDVVIIIDASFDVYGPIGRDLLMLPGIFAISACALWAQKRPAVAAYVGAVVLGASSLLLWTFQVQPYGPVLANVSLAETVTGFQLVYFCVRHVRAGIAFIGVSSLIVACLIAVTGRSEDAQFDNRNFPLSLVFGLFILGTAVLLGLRSRHSHPKRTNPVVAKIIRDQWPIIGGLTLLLFFEVVGAAGVGVRAVPVLACSVAAAALAVFAVKSPIPIALGMSALFLFSGMIAGQVNLRAGYPQIGGLTLTQIVSGMIMVVVLIRVVPREKAWPTVGLLSGVVAVVSIVDTVENRNSAALSQLVVAAVLLLGISVAIGLYLKSRDSERAQVVHSAVTEAQTSERMALARELHDVVAHHVTGIVVLAQAAKMSAEKNPKVAAEALGRIDVAGTEALAAMRRLVRSMRDEAAAGSSDFSEQATTDLAADLRKLVDGANHGVTTTVELDLPAHLPQEVGRSALRLVQESLTNVGKHAAGASAATVLAEVTDGELHLRVSDDGKEQDRHPAGGSGGYGLIGMRERVELLHGRLFAGRGPEGGWRVEAWLPLEGDS
jgi:signal transduction histidine kinase